MWTVVALTLDGEDDPLADGGRDAVLGDAEVGAHLRPGDPNQVQHLAMNLTTLCKRIKES